MITTKVTEKHLAEWHYIYMQKKGSLKPNITNGSQLDDYFKSKYTPSRYDNDEFKRIVYENAKNESNETTSSDIATYLVGNDIFVGIDLRSGYFHVESENIEDSIPVWDDLFVNRGLNEADLNNYVLVAQYVILKNTEQ